MTPCPEICFRETPGELGGYRKGGKQTSSSRDKPLSGMSGGVSAAPRRRLGRRTGTSDQSSS